jgi:hypothetical protein
MTSTLGDKMMKLSIDSDMKITEDMLSEVLQAMKKQRLDSLSVDDLLGMLNNLLVKRKSRFTVEEPDFTEEADESLDASFNDFTFKSPSLKFPLKKEKPVFPVKEEISPNHKKASSRVSHPQKVEESVPQEESKWPLNGFYETARQSIPANGDMNTPDKFTEYGFESTNQSSNIADAARKTLFSENQSNDNPSVSRSTDSNAAWFWGTAQQQQQQQPQPSAPTLGQPIPSLFKSAAASSDASLQQHQQRTEKKSTFDTIEPKFTLGSADTTARPKSKPTVASSLFNDLKSKIKSPPKAEEPLHHSSSASIPSFNFDYTSQPNDDKKSNEFNYDGNAEFNLGNSAASSSRPSTAKPLNTTFKVYSLGASDILHSLNDDNSPRPEVPFFGSQPQPSDDVEMAVDSPTTKNDEEREQNFPSFVPPSKVSPDLNATNPTSESNSEKTASTKSYLFTDIMSDAFKGLNLDEDTIAFSLGSASTATTGGSRTAKKSAMKRNQSAKKPSTKPSTSESQQANDINMESVEQPFASINLHSQNIPASAVKPNLSEKEEKTTGTGFNGNNNNNNNNNVKENLQNNEIPSLKTPRSARKKAEQQHDAATDIPSFLPKQSSKLGEEAGAGGLEDSDVPPSWWSTANGTTEPLNTVRREEFPSFDINDDESSSENNNDNDDDISTGEENEPSTAHRPVTSQSTTKTQKEKRHTSMSADSTDTHTSTQSDRSLLNLAEEYSKQGKELYAEGQYDRALEAYDTCLKFAPKSWLARATILGNRAAVNFMLGR